jgi:simple sugar transport system permease protein
MDAFVVIAISARSTDVFKACVVIVVCLLQSSRVRNWLLNVLRWGRPSSRRREPEPPAAGGPDRPAVDLPDATGTGAPTTRSVQATP